MVFAQVPCCYFTFNKNITGMETTYFPGFVFKKGKTYLPYAMKHTGGTDVQLLSFLTLAPDRSRWSNSRTGWPLHPPPPLRDGTPVTIE
jgi:hypothetical protein